MLIVGVQVQDIMDFEVTWKVRILLMTKCLFQVFMTYHVDSKEEQDVAGQSEYTKTTFPTPIL